MPSIRLI